MVNNKRFSFLFILLTSLFCVALIVSNVIAGKLWQTPLPNIVLTAGVFLFPIVYIIGDVVPEVYGLQNARKVIWLGFALNLFAVFFFWLTIKLPFPVFYENQPAMEIVLGFTPRLLLASFVGYLIGTNANAWVLVMVKKLTKEKYLWVRTISSTIVGESLDSLFFMSIAFYGIVPLAALPTMIFAQATFKTCYEIIATPLTYIVVNKVKKLESF